MRAKTDTLIITFNSTSSAMAAEKHFVSKELPGRLIPLPSEMSAGCGLAWKAPVNTRELLRHELDEAGIDWDVIMTIKL